MVKNVHTKMGILPMDSLPSMFIFKSVHRIHGACFRFILRWPSLPHNLGLLVGHTGSGKSIFQRFALFIADPNGGIYTAAGDPQGGFGPWASVSEGRSMPGAPVTAVPWGNRFALFIADPNGGIYSLDLCRFHHTPYF